MFKFTNIITETMDHNEIAKLSISQSLSWTHYIRLMRISDPKELAFYKIEANCDVTQDVTQETVLDQWIEYQIAANPKITTYELAELSGKTSRTIKRHLVKLPHIRFIGSGYSGHWEIDNK